METKEIMKQFMESHKKRNKEYERKQISLKKVNSVKFCPNCKEFVSIVMDRLDGFCDGCKEQLYTIKNNEKRI